MPSPRSEIARRAVLPLVERLDLERRVEPWKTLQWDGSQRATPSLHVDDFSGIPFLAEITGVEEYQHRSRLRAQPGDLYAAVTPPTEGYEEYCRTWLGLEPAEFLHATPVDGPLDLARACSAGLARKRAVEVARAAGGLAIEPFMGIEAVWELARGLSETAGVPVRVMAPPPAVTWIANDKGLFGEVVERVLGPEWLVETLAGADARALTRHLLSLAGRHRQVGLKRLRCASAMGNAVFESGRLLRMRAAEVEEEVRVFLERTEWDGVEEVLAVAWEATEVSPSTQLLVPPVEVGPPRLDGIYEQILAGQERVFVGSRPSSLPPEVDRALGEASLVVASALQGLGYVGRCSFDFLLVGDPGGEHRLRFTECNGRWGGTSTPMAFIDRLLGRPRPPYRAQDFIRPELVGVPFSEILDLVGDELWRAADGRGRFIFYNTGPLARHGKLDVIALGRSQEEAEAAIEEELPRLLSVSRG